VVPVNLEARKEHLLALGQELLGVGFDLGGRQNRAGLVLAGGVSELCCDGSENQDELMSFFLELPAEPDGNEVAEMESVSRRVDTELDPQGARGFFDVGEGLLRQGRKVTSES